MKRWGEHESYWIHGVRQRPYDVLRQDLKVDTVVVGAGITGLTTAYRLAKAKKRVAVVTAGRIDAGTTARSTGHLTQILDDDFNLLVSHFGKATMKKVVKSIDDAIQFVDYTSKAESIDCDFQRVSGFKFTESLMQKEQLENEVELARELGVEIALTKRSPLPFPVAAVAEVANQAQFDPFKYALGLAHAFVAAGGLIFEDSRVLKIEDGSPAKIETEYGSVSANEIVLATHTPVGVYISLHTRVAPYFSYVLAARLKNPPPPGLYWDMNDPYNYFRPAKKNENIWIIGGKDHKTGQQFSTLEKYLELEEFIRLRFDVEKFEYYWGAELYESVDGLPYIGKIPFTSNIYTATGFAGQGLTFGTLAGTILSDILNETKNAWAPLYDPMRLKPLASAGSFIKENVNVAKWMMSDFLTHEDLTKVNSIPPGQGRVVEIGDQKFAVYKDEKSNLTTLSPLCTHMGCTVHWNTAEKTWDCPCHGGRYSPEGEVIAGPPLKDLTPVSMVAQRAEEETLMPVPSLGIFSPMPELQ